MIRPLLLIGLLTTIAAAELRVEPFIDGSKKSSPLNTPFGIEFDGAGHAYIVELDGGRIHKRTRDGALSVISGDGSKSYKGDGGPAKDATYNGMHNLAVTPAGDLYIADTWNNVIRRIDHKTGLVSTIAGTGEKGFAGDGGPAVKAKFSGTFCVALSPGRDKLIITDLGNKRVRLVDLATGLVDTVAGNGKGGVPKEGAMAKESPLADPRAAVMDSKGNLYILERGGHALRVVSPDGRIQTVAGATGKAGKQDGPAGQSTLNGPKHLCVDRDDHILIADAENHLIRRYDAKTGLLSTLPITGLARPHGVTVTADGTLYVVDSYNHRVLRCRHRDEPSP
jgi:sugar lactone lactonase YvrE